MDKVCPQCSTAVNVRRAVCGCGHAFPSKRKAQCGNISQAMKHSTMQKTNARASETPEQTLNRRETDKVRKTRKRTSETSEQTVNRQETDKVRKTRKRASETSEQTLNRQETDKVRKTRLSKH